MTTNGSLLRRARAGAGRRRADARHGQPRLARRRDVQRHERRRLPGREGARRHRRGGRRRASRPVKVEHGRQARRQRRRHRVAGRALPRHRRTSCASSSSWTSAPPTAGGWTTSFRRQEIVERINAIWPLEPVDRTTPARSPPASATCDGGGEIGIIASVTQPFCGACTRARLSAEGKLYTCLFAAGGHDLRELLRSGVNDAQLDEQHPRHLDAAHRSLLRAPHRRDDLAAEGRDVAHRRLATGRSRGGSVPGTNPTPSPRRVVFVPGTNTTTSPRLVVFVPGTNTTPSLRLVVFVPGTNTTAQTTSRDSLRERCAKGARTVPDLVCPRREACRGDRFGAWHRICPRATVLRGVWSGPARSARHWSRAARF